MITLNSPLELYQLPVDDEIISAVRYEIEQPFGSLTAATEFWEEVGTSLLFIETDDDLQSLASHHSALSFALQYPEWSLELPQDYQLSVAVVTDEGSGCYLLCPSHLINTENQS